MVKYLLLRLEEVNRLANIKSAEKRIRTINKKTALNRSRKTEIRSLIKKFDLAIENNNIDEAKELLKVIDKKLKKATHKNVIHENTAARKVSSLTKKLNRKINGEEAV